MPTKPPIDPFALGRAVKPEQRLTPAHYVAVRVDGLSFMTCLEAAVETPGLVREFDRLYGTTLATRQSPINAMVDKATGKCDADIQAFMHFIWNDVFLRVPMIKPETCKV